MGLVNTALRCTAATALGFTVLLATGCGGGNDGPGGPSGPTANGMAIAAAH